MRIVKPLVPVMIARPNHQIARERGVAASAIKNRIIPCTECSPKVPGLTFWYLFGYQANSSFRNLPADKYDDVRIFRAISSRIRLKGALNVRC